MNFSVLLSLYSKEKPEFLKEALDSVFNQTIPPAEVILVKDGPLNQELDKILDQYILKYPNFKVISLPTNIGLGYALNEGLKHCTYEWIARMDTDDICYPNRFEKQIEAIKLHPEVSFLGSCVAEFSNSKNHIVSYRSLPKENDEIFKYAKTRSPMNHPTVMYKKQAVMDLGGYGEFPEDYHLWIRALMKGYLFYNIQEPLLYYRSNKSAIKRRGGFKYAIAEIKHQKAFYDLGFISFPLFVKNSLSRFILRIAPSRIRMHIYSKALRTKTLKNES